MFSKIRTENGGIDALINNAGIASMNHSLLTNMSTVKKILNPNIIGTSLLCPAKAKLMPPPPCAGIIKGSTVAVPPTKKMKQTKHQIKPPTRRLDTTFCLKKKQLIKT
jgi:Short-chain dehydrogenases of various substrate specificities